MREAGNKRYGTMKKIIHRGKRHYSGKELLERRKAEREEYENRLAKRETERRKGEKDYFGFPIRYYSVSKICAFNKISVF